MLRLAAAVAVVAVSNAQFCSICKWGVGQAESYIAAHESEAESELCADFVDMVQSEFPICVGPCTTMVTHICQDVITAVKQEASGSINVSPTAICNELNACGSSSWTSWLRNRRQVDGSFLGALRNTLVGAEGERVLMRALNHAMMAKEIYSPELESTASKFDYSGYCYTSPYTGQHRCYFQNGYEGKRLSQSSGCPSRCMYAHTGDVAPCSGTYRPARPSAMSGPTLTVPVNQGRYLPYPGLFCPGSIAALKVGDAGDAHFAAFVASTGNRSRRTFLSGDLCSPCEWAVGQVESWIEKNGATDACNYAIREVNHYTDGLCTGHCETLVQQMCHDVIQAVIQKASTGSLISPSDICTDDIHVCGSSDSRGRRQTSFLSTLNSTARETGLFELGSALAHSVLRDEQAKPIIKTTNGQTGKCYPDTSVGAFSCTLQSVETAARQAERGTSLAARRGESSSSSSHSSKLSSGDDVGIAVGAAALVAIIAVIALFARSESKKKSASEVEFEAPLVVDDVEYAGAK